MSIDDREIPAVNSIPGLTIRYTIPQDGEYLKEWLLEPEAKYSFPMSSELEVDDSVRRWISFSRIRSSLTAEMDGHPVGMSTLYVQTYKRLVHQTEFGIIVAPKYRGRGIGSFLLSSIMKFAKQQFGIELIHLQVYQHNPAIRLYAKFGFVEFGRQTHWIKDENGQYMGRIFMERFL